MDDASHQPAPALRESTDRLVRLLQASDPRAGEILHELYRDALVRFCWGYLGDLEAAEDAYQDICCKVLAATSIPPYFRPWLYRMARNHCLNRLRGPKNQRAMPHPSELQDMLTGQLTRLVRREQNDRLADMVGRLSESHREVLRLRYVEELSRTEIASVLDLSESVVKSRLFEGLKQLRARAVDSEETP